MRAGLGGLGATVHGNCCRKEARRGVQGLKTKGSSILVDTGMAKGNHKKTYTPEDISSKNSVLEDQLIGSFDRTRRDGVATVGGVNSISAGLEGSRRSCAARRKTFPSSR